MKSKQQNQGQLFISMHHEFWCWFHGVRDVIIAKPSKSRPSYIVGGSKGKWSIACCCKDVWPNRYSQSLANFLWGCIACLGSRATRFVIKNSASRYEVNWDMLNASAAYCLMGPRLDRYSQRSTTSDLANIPKGSVYSSMLHVRYGQHTTKQWLRHVGMRSVCQQRLFHGC